MSNVRPHMRRAWLVVVAILSALVLTTGYLGHALSGAGKYSAQLEVRVWVGALLLLTYSALFATLLFVVRKLRPFARGMLLWLLLVGLVIAGGVLVWLAPAVTLGGMALLCQVRAACPDAANPIAWAFLALIGPRELPFSPFWVVVFAVMSCFLLQRAERLGENGA